jgi:hypothetical protein
MVIFHSYVKLPEGTADTPMAGWLMVYPIIQKAGWWCNVPILKNDGVKVNGVGDDIPYIIMDTKKCLKPPTSKILMAGWLMSILENPKSRTWMEKMSMSFYVYF